MTRPIAPSAYFLLVGALAACSGGGGSGESEQDEPALAFSFQAAAGDVGEGSATTVAVVLHTTRPVLGSEVTLEVIDLETGSATAGTDYNALGTVLVTFSADAVDGDVQTVALTSAQDLTVEGADETVELALANPSAGKLIAPQAFSATILDGDHATIEFLSATSATSDEQTTTHSVTIGLELAAGVELGVSAEAMVQDAGTGDATAGADYTTFAGEAIDFPAGSQGGTTVSVTLSVLDDALPEVDEKIVLALASPTAGTLLGSIASHQVTISDDDNLPESNFDASEGQNGIENALDYDELIDLGTQTVGGGPNAGTHLRVANTGGQPLALGVPLLGGSHPNDFAVEVELASNPPPRSSVMSALEGPALEALSPLIAVPHSALPSEHAARPGQALALDPARVRELAPAARATLHGFAVPGMGELTLALERLRLPLAPQAELRVDGVPQSGGLAAALGDLSLWRGEVLEVPGSRVFLAFSSTSAHGYLEFPDAGGLLHVTTDTDERGPRECRIVRESDLAQLGVERPVSLCAEALAVPGAPRSAPAPAETGDPASDNLSSSDCVLVVETDYQYYQRFNSSQGAINYATSLLAAVSDQYFTDIQTTLSIAYLGIYTSAGDPWTEQDSGGNALDVLLEFRSAWNANGWPAAGQLAHFLSGANLGGGVAYLDVLCNPSYAFGVSGNISGNINWSTWSGNAGSFTWDFVVTAHELGHNFGSSHTHEYCPPLDHCYTNCDNTTSCTQGTIMSYCHTCGGMDNIDLHFHPATANVMRQSVATCIGAGELAGGDYVQYRVRFNPLVDSGLRSATLEFEHDAPNQPQPFRVRLQGTGN